MSVLSKVMGVFKGFGKLVVKALGAAHAAGLTDDVVDLALKWVRVAAGQSIENPAKRDLVIQILRNKGIPGSLAALAVELAYQLYLAEVKPKLD